MHKCRVLTFRAVLGAVGLLLPQLAGAVPIMTVRTSVFQNGSPVANHSVTGPLIIGGAALNDHNLVSGASLDSSYSAKTSNTAPNEMMVQATSYNAQTGPISGTLAVPSFNATATSNLSDTITNATGTTQHYVLSFLDSISARANAYNAALAHARIETTVAVNGIAQITGFSLDLVSGPNVATKTTAGAISIDGALQCLSGVGLASATDGYLAQQSCDSIHPALIPVSVDLGTLAPGASVTYVIQALAQSINGGETIDGGVIAGYKVLDTYQSDVDAFNDIMSITLTATGPDGKPLNIPLLSSVPEPSALALLPLSVVALARLRRQSRTGPAR